MTDNPSAEEIDRHYLRLYADAWSYERVLAALIAGLSIPDRKQEVSPKPRKLKLPPADDWDGSLETYESVFDAKD